MDNRLVHYSGLWIFKSGVPAGGAKLYVYNEDTTDLSDIWSDRDLGITMSNPVTADADGLMPFAYIGTQAYKVKLTTAAGATIDEEDDLPGALNTVPFAASTFAKPDTDVASKTSDYTVVEADLGTVINGSVTGGTIQVTLISAVTAGNGKGVTIRHVGTANYVKIVSVSSQTITRPATGVTTTGFALVGYGESVTLKSDGANWHIDAYVPPLITATTGVIVIKDRVNSAPVGPNPGDRYIVSGAFSTFEQEDIIEADGQGNYIEYTPAEDCGWIAYVQDENLYYFFRGTAWAAETASSTQQGTVKVSTQAIMETGAATDAAVLVGHQHFHPGHPKCWAVVTVSAGTPTLATSYNVASVTDTAQGRLTVTIATDFSGVNWAPVALVESESTTAGRWVVASNGTKAAGAIELACRDQSGTLTDPTAWHLIGCGDLT